MQPEHVLQDMAHQANCSHTYEHIGDGLVKCHHCDHVKLSSELTDTERHDMGMYRELEAGRIKLWTSD